MKRSQLSYFISESYTRRKTMNFIICGILALATIVALIPLFSAFGYVLWNGLPGLSWDFFIEIPRPVGEAGGGMANGLLGTATLILIASLIGIPWGIATGVYLSEYGRGKTASIVRFSTEMLTSVPSIVIGLFVYTVVVVPMQRFSAFAGGVALSIIMIPTVARSTEELLKLVPDHIREAGLALGLPRWKVTLRIVLRGSLKAIMTGVILALARAAGETAPLLFTAFNNSSWQRGLDQPVASLPVQIFTYAISPFEDWHSKAWSGALVLMLFVFMINLGVKTFMRTGRTS